MTPKNDHDFIELNLPAEAKYFSVASACITEMLTPVSGIGEREMTTYSIQLAVQEICTNIVDHAYAGSSGRITVILTVVEEPLRMLVDVRDDADRGFDPTTVDVPSAEDLAERGRGLLLIRQLVEEALYQPVSGPYQFRSRTGGDWELETKPLATAPGGNHWLLVKQL